MKKSGFLLSILLLFATVDLAAEGRFLFGMNLSDYRMGAVDNSDTYTGEVVGSPDDLKARDLMNKVNVGGALAYSPFEIGYLFDNGIVLKTGFELFFFESQEIITLESNEDGNADNGLELKMETLDESDYTMTNWVNTLLYQIQLPFPVKPFVGVTIEIIGGSRVPHTNIWPGNVAGNPLKLVAAKQEDAWNLSGSAAVGGFAWHVNDSWMISAQMRYLFPYSGVQPPMLITGLGINYLL